MFILSCAKCGADFAWANSAKRYCCLLCKKQASRERETKTYQCVYCGCSYKSRKPSSKYCSVACGNKDRDKESLRRTAVCRWEKYSHDESHPWFRFWDKRTIASRYKAHLKAGYALAPCFKCKKNIAPRKSVICKSCATKTHGQISWEKTIKGTIYCCPVCEVKFSPLLGNNGRTTCSDECRIEFARSLRHKSKAIRRAKEKAVDCEPVDAFKVFIRDGWRCQICGVRTLMSKRGSVHKKAPELDHRVPLSKGGPHTYANTQTTCRRCNQEKGNRSSVGQLPLFDAAQGLGG